MGDVSWDPCLPTWDEAELLLAGSSGGSGGTLKFGDRWPDHMHQLCHWLCVTLPAEEEVRAVLSAIRPEPLVLVSGRGGPPRSGPGPHRKPCHLPGPSGMAVPREPTAAHPHPPQPRLLPCGSEALRPGELTPGPRAESHWSPRCEHPTSQSDGEMTAGS